MEYKIKLDAKEIGIIQSALEHIDGILATELIRGKINRQFVRQLKEIQKE